MQVKVLYFAALKEACGTDEEHIETSAHSARELYRELQARHGALVREDLVNVSVNRHLSGLDVAINEGDEVVFIPPVAGG